MSDVCQFITSLHPSWGARADTSLCRPMNSTVDSNQNSERPTGQGDRQRDIFTDFRGVSGNDRCQS